jgi:hypothetical protein
MLHHDERDRREDLIHRVRAALDAHGLPVPGFDATGDLDHQSLAHALAPLGFQFLGLRQTVESAWRASFHAPDGQRVEVDAFSREDALAGAVLAALGGMPV